ncbi:RNA polymerase sigma-70 factor [Mucilaginibacter terrae]|uniref:RNA polymerase sigma-70 factor (Family 1) n=1 Tax=Mucilaginibacter terrae TaxID=1955052 RepID=A0ABU3GUB8_9SPHI|nr:RNA polymerase sigma-70 factor [Mucilaginibacter terrae]MDT3403255.1 RNA polymerase sigma-70 factor (family 1) [Mucilaginibacter terrae]
MLRLSNLNDIQLLELIKSDNEAAFEEVYNRYWRSLYSFAYKRVKSREVAEEIVQDFLTNFWANRKKINIQSTFEGYVYMSVKHLVLNYFAKESRRMTLADNILNLNIIHNPVYHNSTEEWISLHELNNIIKYQVSQLPIKCRSVFELSRVQNKSNKEIAQTLGISEKTVEGHLSKAIKKLRLSIEVLVATVIVLFN